MLKKLKLRNTLKKLACCILSASMLTEFTANVWASASEEDMPELDAFSLGIGDLAEFLYETRNLGDLGDFTLTFGDEDGENRSSKSYIHLTDEAFDVTDFGELDDENKALAFAGYEKNVGEIFRSILSCEDLESLKTAVRGKFIIEGIEFPHWYSMLSQMIRVDEKFFIGADKDQLLDLRVLYMREAFLRAVYVSVCDDFAPDDLTKQRVFLINQHFLRFAKNNNCVFSPDDVKKVYDKIGDLLLKNAKRRGFADCFLRHSHPERYKRGMGLHPRFGEPEVDMDFRLMSRIKASKRILVAAYEKLKEADQLLSSGRYLLSFKSVGESQKLMEEFQKSYSSVLPYCVVSQPIIDEYYSVCSRWNKIKDTLDGQFGIYKKFNDTRTFINGYLNQFFMSSEEYAIDWFVNLGDRLSTVPVRSEFSQQEIELMDDLITILTNEKKNMVHDYNASLLDCERIQSIFRRIDFCIDNISRLKIRAQEQLRINAQVAADAEHRREVRQARNERQEALRLRREREALEERECLAREAEQRRAAAGTNVEEPQEYQITYINDEVKSEAQKFLRNNKDAEALWKKWFNEVRVTGSSTMNYLPNMRSQRAAFLRFRRGLIRLAPGDVIYEARLDTSGEQAGMRVVYYIEKDTHKVVILYVGLPFGIIHKNVVSVSVNYASFPEASLDDCEVPSDSESATESASSASSGSKSGSKSSKEKRGCGDDDDDDSEEESVARSSSSKKNKKSRKKERGHKGHKK